MLGCRQAREGSGKGTRIATHGRGINEKETMVGRGIELEKERRGKRPKGQVKRIHRNP